MTTFNHIFEAINWIKQNSQGPCGIVSGYFCEKYETTIDPNILRKVTLKTV